MATYLERALCVVALLLPTSVMANNGLPPPGYTENLASAAGQLDGLSVACGKVSAAMVSAHRAKMRQSLGAKGLAPATFDRLYDGAYKDMVSKAKANPAQTKAACARVSAIGSTAH